jgi:mannose-1-phosphate guanylyltransferase/mannose-6-phosphate isomerase
MEKSDKVMMVPLDAGWNDVGSWLALLTLGAKDSSGNVIQGDVIAQATTHSYIRAEHHMVATLGVTDLIIVDTPDATLVASKDQVHRVKAVVDRLKQQNRDEPTCHRKVCRPWGWYDVIEVGECFQVKRLHVNPGGKLSLQLHHQRAEHWVVVSGVATVTNGEQLLTLKKGESTYIPIGVKHSLENSNVDYLELIEVQSGAYLGEDDIVRFEDVYGRNKQTVE